MTAVAAESRITRVDYIAYRLKRAVIFAAVGLLPRTRSALLLAALPLMIFRPTARRHLHHFLYGNGRSVTLPASRLLHDDPGVRRQIAGAVHSALRARKASGTVMVSQRHFHNMDLLYALGATRVHWEKCGLFVRIWFRTRYRWRPAEVRVSQALHRRACALIPQGAAEFDIAGDAAMVAVSELDHEPVPVEPSVEAVMYLL